MLKVIKPGLVFIGLFLLACDSTSSSRRGGKRNSPEREDTRGDLENETARSRERDRLTGSSSEVIDSFLEGRQQGSSSYGNYGGSECKLSEECMRICDDLKGAKARCARQPEDLVRDIKDGLFELITISEVDSVEMSPALFYGILEIDMDLVEDLIEDHMNEGDLKSFLAWIALNEDIAGVLEREDRRLSILEKAFEELGRLQSGGSRDTETGLNTGLIGSDDTFLYLASDVNNESAFVMGHELVDQECSGSNCKLEMYCARRLQARQRRRGGERSSFSCRTPEKQRRSSSREQMCYVHGSDVWSYLYELITEKKIRDSNLDDFVINVEKCNETCGNKNSEKCKDVL